MIGRLWVNKCHWRASSLLFMPDGCNVLALVIKWASRAFLTESRLLRMSSIGMRRTSLIEWLAWLECSDTGVVVMSCWWFKIELRCSPKRSLSWRLVSPMYWRWHFLHSIRYVRFFEWQDMESVIFLASLVVKKVSELVWPSRRKEQVRQRGWLHFLIPAGCWLEKFSCERVEWTSRARRLALRL